MMTLQEIMSKMETMLATGSKSEKIIMQYLLSDFPISALGNITAISKQSTISPATIQRTIIKLGFKSFPLFRETILSMLHSQKLSSPFARLQDNNDKESTNDKIQHYKSNIANILETFKNINEADINNAVKNLADKNKNLWCVGGRFTGNLTSLFARHMKTIRPNVREHLTYEGSLIDTLVNCNNKSTILITDIRRYDMNLLQFANIAKVEKKATIILLTDYWGSPIKEYADITIPVHTGTNACWDSNVALLTMLEELMERATLELGDTAKSLLKMRENHIKKYDNIL